jgi:hypothetical protein
MDNKELNAKLEEYSEGKVDVAVAYDGYSIEL